MVGETASSDEASSDGALRADATLVAMVEAMVEDVPVGRKRLRSAGEAESPSSSSPSG
eukprot:CAMPEP_0174697720 /NCGR_PEP_ID=MMETSP1094-20130205/3506_1 /TAXON_ID=156173 /ORGANISM="Chrysochromulina brevifilum, Strain UTEX LB 985" /LENGTH=57 /DNA_ID=CAMNT_0015894753 /DNA_START=183 /DNA_END=356 /DNA_ORIENTATION=-